MESWIIFTLLAVVMQSVRTAGQKKLATRLSVQATTLVRFLFGLPFAVLYFYLMATGHSDSLLQPTATFFVSASLAAVAQILATVCLVQALTLRNFAVGSTLAKTEAVITAIIGALFFDAALTLAGYLSVVLGVAGLLVASNWKISARDLADNQSIRYGLGAGLGFALASLWIRQASLSLEVSPLLGAAAVLCYMVALQTAICLVWIASRERQQLRLIRQNLPGSLFIGLTSVAGSIGWFTAMSLQNPALVKTLGQAEFLLTLIITYVYFRERVSTREYLGMLLVVVSIVLLLGLVDG